ncbi:unnamed protein product [Blepharisma stoltei]|uniref:Uncharacterized protein n=1 Tax=Blepharisma stoltei TaxID=1481888 RepID=A0AAU9JJL3_9CILI|nr:unnamed protein product [Blepharisma stoltei]
MKTLFEGKITLEGSHTPDNNSLTDNLLFNQRNDYFFNENYNTNPHGFSLDILTCAQEIKKPCTAFRLLSFDNEKTSNLEPFQDNFSNQNFPTLNFNYTDKSQEKAFKLKPRQLFADSINLDAKSALANGENLPNPIESLGKKGDWSSLDSKNSAGYIGNISEHFMLPKIVETNENLTKIDYNEGDSSLTSVGDTCEDDIVETETKGNQEEQEINTHQHECHPSSHQFSGERTSLWKKFWNSLNCCVDYQTANSRQRFYKCKKCHKSWLESDFSLEMIIN